MRRRHPIPTLHLGGAWLSLALVGCGGSAASNPSKSPSSEEAEAPETNGEAFAPGEDPLGETPQKPAATSSDSTCTSGQCSPCGGAVCPEGFYCDTELGACGWLPECSGSHLNCECLEKSLANCTCSDDDGVRVSCPTR